MAVDPELEREAKEEAEEHEPSAVVAARAMGVMVFEEEANETLAGGGLSVEHPFGHHVSGEIAVGAASGSHVTEVPIELLVARTWEFHALEPYIGIGPTLLVKNLHEEGAASETSLRWGGTAIVGTHIWASKHWGFLLEADGQLTMPDHATFASEVITGVVGRWN